MGYTLKRKVTIDGTGIHSGQPVKMTLLPSQNKGIRFILPNDQVTIPVNLKHVRAQNLGTNVVKGKISIHTIEHLMSVLWYFKITDVDIMMNGREVPIGGGSGQHIYDAIRKTGRRKTNTQPKVLVIKEILYQEFKHDSFFLAVPGKGLTINYSVNFPMNPIKAQNYIFRKRREYPEQICGNRTFGNINDVDKLHQSGLARGAGMHNALVYDDHKFLNAGDHQNEPVRHKILDLLGDLYVSGYFVQGKIIAYKTSHKTNNRMIKKLVNSFAQ